MADTHLGIREIDVDTYHADAIDLNRASLSASIAHTLLTSSPRHAWTQHPRLNPDFERVEEDKFSIGTVAHELLLRGEEIVEVVSAHDWRTKAAQEARNAARASGRIPLLEDQWIRVQEMVAAAHEQIESVTCTPALFADGAPEQTLVWEDDGVLCRCRVDWLHFDLSAIDDYKTTAASAEPMTWSRRTMYSIGADIQVAFYLRGLAILHPETAGRVAWRYVVQETFPPYELSVVEVDEPVQALGRLKVEEALALWKDCLARDEWPGYPKQPHRAEVPTWVEMQWMERAA